MQHGIALFKFLTQGCIFGLRRLQLCLKRRIAGLKAGCALPLGSQVIFCRTQPPNAIGKAFLIIGAAGFASAAGYVIHLLAHLPCLGQGAQPHNCINHQAGSRTAQSKPQQSVNFSNNRQNNQHGQSKRMGNKNHKPTLVGKRIIVPEAEKNSLPENQAERSYYRLSDNTSSTNSANLEKNVTVMRLPKIRRTARARSTQVDVILTPGLIFIMMPRYFNENFDAGILPQT
ncbi:hypothetical protein [Desulfovibrio sp.]|uniref:hypothetical protein n=2 Tax=Desulfovibrio TaxID=872 RepID=UPI0026311CDA|nr:hypothetical protein [Desulfovibrio sp.]